MVVKKQKWIIPLAFAVLVLLFQIGCGTTGSAEKHVGQAHWGYSGETAPEFWYALDPAFAIARDGKAQSPIDIATASLADGGSAQKPVFAYSTDNYEAENNGHTIELKPKSGGNTVVIDGDTYTLRQLHFHAPSEHRLDGKSFEMEVHLVHQNASGELAVAGFLIADGAENSVFKEAFEKLPAPNTPVELETPINLADLFNQDAAFYRYDGSLTTPPCTEGVKWFVSSQAVELSAEQIACFKAVYNGNSRPVQPLNGRAVYRVQ